MESKLFEVRDRGTFIPVLAVAMEVENYPDDNSEAEAFLLERSGYALGHREPLILVVKIDGEHPTANCIPEEWGCQTRTMLVAHECIQEHWKTLKSGDVIDVEHYLDPTLPKKTSEMHSQNTP